MNKTRCILINFYTTFEQLVHNGTASKGKSFSYPGFPVSQSAHPHHALRRVAQAHQHLIVNDQIRRENIYIPLCMVDNVQINILSYCLMI